MTINAVCMTAGAVSGGIIAVIIFSTMIKFLEYSHAKR
jgi:hypothetical protein